jgi:hypothetical protein
MFKSFLAPLACTIPSINAVLLYLLCGVLKRLGNCTRTMEYDKVVQLV